MSNSKCLGFAKKLGLATAVAAAMASGSALAYDAGDMIVRFGSTTVAPEEDSSEVTLDGTGIGGEVGVDSNTQLGLTFTYMLNRNWGVEVLAATPFSHDVSAKGGLVGGTLGIDKVAEVKHLPPTVSAIYYFDSASAFKPYLGLGLNYTVFFSEDASSELEGALAETDVELDDSFGLSFQAGFDYQIDENWIVNASARWIDIDTDATLDVTGVGRVEVDVDIDPLVYSVTVGYQF